MEPQPFYYPAVLACTPELQDVLQSTQHLECLSLGAILAGIETRELVNLFDDVRFRGCPDVVAEELFENIIERLGLLFGCDVLSHDEDVTFSDLVKDPATLSEIIENLAAQYTDYPGHWEIYSTVDLYDELMEYASLHGRDSLSVEEIVPLLDTFINDNFDCEIYLTTLSSDGSVPMVYVLRSPEKVLHEGVWYYTFPEALQAAVNAEFAEGGREDNE